MARFVGSILQRSCHYKPINSDDIGDKVLTKDGSRSVPAASFELKFVCGIPGEPFLVSRFMHILRSSA
jgi:hypothetical protein